MHTLWLVFLAGAAFLLMDVERPVQARVRARMYAPDPVVVGLADAFHRPAASPVGVGSAVGRFVRVFLRPVFAAAPRRPAALRT
ncbi:MAG: hypothetical protein Q4G39_06150 [Brachymonas sp.]|nr:hypothetical protein [Brachymonas sp.]